MAKEVIKVLRGQVKKYLPDDKIAIKALKNIGITAIPQEIEDRAFFEEEEIGQVVRATPNSGGDEYIRVQYGGVVEKVFHKWKETEKFSLTKFKQVEFEAENKGKDSTKWRLE